MPSSPVSAFDFGSNSTAARKGETTVQRNRLIQRIKATLLLTVAATGGMMFSSCGLVDLRQSAIAGTQAFATGYVAAFWNSIIPATGTLLGADDGDDDGA